MDGGDRRRFEEGYDIFDPEYIHWLKNTTLKQYQLVTQHQEFQVLRYPLNQKPLLLQICPTESVPLILRVAVVSPAQTAVLF